MLPCRKATRPGLYWCRTPPRLRRGWPPSPRRSPATSVSILPAGGGPEGTLGTDGDLVARAILQADSGAGVVVLADLGSAVLSAKAVLAEGMTDGIDVRLVDAPLVEGAVAAAVTASIGADLDGVVAAAEEAWNVRKL